MTDNDINPVMEQQRDFVAHGLRVADSGRVTIPQEKRARYGISEGDWLHLAVHTDDVTFRANDVEIQRKGQVTLPHRQRERYGVKEGDYVTLEVAESER